MFIRDSTGSLLTSVLQPSLPHVVSDFLLRHNVRTSGEGIRYMRHTEDRFVSPDLSPEPHTDHRAAAAPDSPAAAENAHVPRTNLQAALRPALLVPQLARLSRRQHRPCRNLTEIPDPPAASQPTSEPPGTRASLRTRRPPESCHLAPFPPAAPLTSPPSLLITAARPVLLEWQGTSHPSAQNPAVIPRLLLTRSRVLLPALLCLLGLSRHTQVSVRGRSFLWEAPGLASPRQPQRHHLKKTHPDDHVFGLTVVPSFTPFSCSTSRLPPTVPPDIPCASLGRVIFYCVPHQNPSSMRAQCVFNSVSQSPRR